ncbi:hypothetical protein [Kistimonas asteriae]|uniref:hypothetical protein n=1 Tax=Kistimonas asteriae TaxID=517724 RepID=UPI001BAA4776|nr:hypothetical protein [Kistimonas asteriae]
MNGYEVIYSSPDFFKGDSGFFHKAVDTLWRACPDKGSDTHSTTEVTAKESHLGRFHVKVPHDCFAILVQLGNKLSVKTINAAGCLFINMSALEQYEDQYAYSWQEFFQAYRVFFVSKITGAAIAKVSLGESPESGEVHQFQVVLPPMSARFGYCSFRQRGVGVIPSFLWEQMVFVPTLQAIEFLKDIPKVFKVLEFTSMCEHNRDYFSSNAKFEKIQFRRKAADIVSEFNDFLTHDLRPKINARIAKQRPHGGAGPSSEKTDVVPEADSKVTLGFSACLSEKESAARFPEWSLFSNETLFLNSVDEFEKVIAQYVDEFQYLIYKAIYIQVLKKTGGRFAQHGDNIAYQVRCDLENDGIEAAFDHAIKEFDQRFKATVMVTEYGETPPTLGSRFGCLTHHLLRYVNYLVKIGQGDLAEHFNRLLMCFSAIDQQNVGHFMGEAVTAYLDGGEDCLCWNRPALDIEDFKREVDEDGADYDTVLVEGITGKFSNVQSICRFFSSASHEKSVFLSNLRLYSQEFSENLSRVTISNFMRDVVKKEHGCNRLSDPDGICAESWGTSCQKKLFFSGLIRAIRLSIEANEPVQEFFLLMLSHGYDEFLDMISGFFEFCERQG